MSVTVERAVAVGLGLADTPTQSSQVDATNDVLVSVVGYRANESADITAVTRNGEAQTFIAYADEAETQGAANPAHRLEVWYRNNPSTGTANIIGTNSVFKNTAMGYLVFVGADPANPIPGADVVSGGDFTAASTTISATVPNMTTDDLAVLCVVVGSWDDGFADTSGATATDGGGQSRQFAQFADTAGAGVPRVIVTTKTGTGNVALSVVMSTSNIYGYVAFRVKSAVASSGPSISTQNGISRMTIGSTAGQRILITR